MSEVPAESTHQKRNEAYAILPHPSEPRLLMLPEESGWSLPHFPRSEGWPPAVADVAPAIRALFGVDAHVLRCVHYHDGGEEDGEETIFALEYTGEIGLPPGARWIGSADLHDLPLTYPAHRDVLGAWLAAYQSAEVPEERPPWQRPGWHSTTTAWILDRLVEAGMPATGHVEQVKNWGISCVLRVPTTAGYVYFKAVPPLFAQEPVVTRALAAAHPRHVPTPIAIDVERRWMLLPDIGSVLLGNSGALHWEAALRAFAAIQLDWSERAPELLALGAEDRRLHVLQRQIDPHLEKEAVMRSLPDEDYARLRAAAPRLKAMCDELASYGLPQTLMHGDFHAGNIAVRGEDIIFFDWTDTCVAHPFLDPPTVLHDLPGSSYGDDTWDRVRDVYLQPWTRYASMEHLRAAYTLAEPLTALHQSISYEHIVGALEPASKVELESGVGGWLKGLLRILERSDSTA